MGRKWEGSGAVAPLSQVVATWVCKAKAWKAVPPVSAALTQSLVGVTLFSGYQARAALDVAAQGTAANCMRCSPRETPAPVALIVSK
jgi:hypothetical protein